jgi:hypothetical protein
MAETPHASTRKTPLAEPPGGGEQDHDAMRSAAMHPVVGPAATADLAAGGGLEVPGRDPQAASDLAEAMSPVHRHEPIPGERDRDNLTHREPGAVGGQFSGGDVPAPARGEWMDDRTAAEHALEGGGDGMTKARKRVEEGREPEGPESDP